MKNKCVCVVLAVLILLCLTSCAKSTTQDFYSFAQKELNAKEMSLADDLVINDGKAHVLYLDDKTEIKLFRHEMGATSNEYVSKLYCSTSCWWPDNVKSLAWYSKRSDRDLSWVLILRFKNSSEALYAFYDVLEQVNQESILDIKDLKGEEFHYNDVNNSGHLMFKFDAVFEYYRWLSEQFGDSNKLPSDKISKARAERLYFEDKMPEYYSTYLKDDCVICTHYCYVDDDYDEIDLVSDYLNVENPQNISYDEDASYMLLDYLTEKFTGRYCRLWDLSLENSETSDKSDLASILGN